MIATVLGAGIGSFVSLFYSSANQTSPSAALGRETSGLLIVASAGFLSLMIFGFLLLWRLRNSVYDIFMSLSTDKISLLHYLLNSLLFYAVFSNSYVVEEASVHTFCLITAITSYVVKNQKHVEGKKAVFAAVLLVMGIVRMTHVLFRCREEQHWCVATDYHKPLGNLSTDVSKQYKNWRFIITTLSVFLTVRLPHQWLKECGHLNSISIPALAWHCLTKFAPILLVCNWALQAINVFNLEAWQQHFFAQIVMGMCLLAIMVIIIHPNLVYKENIGGEKQKKDALALSGLLAGGQHQGVEVYWNYMKSNWKQQKLWSTNSSSAPEQQKIVLYGIGTAISASFIFIGTSLALMTMLVLGKTPLELRLRIFKLINTTTFWTG